MSNDTLPARWTRLWKIHGSLGWTLKNGQVVAGCGRDASQLIYPEHLKYDLTQKMPYTSLFERLRTFVATPDSLLVACGLSFMDSHISSVIEEALAANPHGAVFAFQYGRLAEQEPAIRIAQGRPNFSVYAYDGAVISATEAPWRLSEAPNEDWQGIRSTFWGKRSDGGDPGMLLGDFAHFSAFLSETHAQLAAPTASGLAITATEGHILPGGPGAPDGADTPDSKDKGTGE